MIEPVATDFQDLVEGSLIDSFIAIEVDEGGRTVSTCALIGRVPVTRAILHTLEFITR